MIKVWSVALAAQAWCVVGSFNDDGLRGGLSGVKWTNWDGRQTCAALDFTLPESEEQVVALVKKALEEEKKVKVVGAGHSFSAIAVSDGAKYISLDRLRGLVNVTHDQENGWLVTVEAGMRLFELNDHLLEKGLALPNLGATTEQSVAGAVATGTHGTGKHLGSLSSQVFAVRLVDGTGKVHAVSESSQNLQERELLQAARVSLGALGIITEITLKCQENFFLRESTISIDLEHLIAQLPNLLGANERMQWYVMPFEPNHNRKNATLLIRETVLAKSQGCWEKSTKPFVKRAHSSGGVVVYECADDSFKALSDSRKGYANRNIYTEMEMHVPVSNSLTVLEEFRAFLSSGLTAHALESPNLATVFLGMRYVASETAWMSPQYQRETAVFSLIVDAGSKAVSGDAALFEELGRKLEKIAIKHGGVPHWGKMNYATAADLSIMYPRLGDFTTLRNRLDPGSLFMNQYLEQRLHLASNNTRESISLVSSEQLVA